MQKKCQLFFSLLLIWIFNMIVCVFYYFSFIELRNSQTCIPIIINHIVICTSVVHYNFFKPRTLHFSSMQKQSVHWLQDQMTHAPNVRNNNRNSKMSFISHSFNNHRTNLRKQKNTFYFCFFLQTFNQAH